MENVESFIHQIVARSSLPSERQAPCFEPETGTSQALIEKRMAAWAHAVAEDGKPEIFEKYLQWEGLTIESARRLVLPVHLRGGAGLPGWADILREIVCLAGEESYWQSINAAENGALDGNPDDPARSIPFFELYQPFVEVCLRHLSLHEAFGSYTGATIEQLKHAVTVSLASFSTESLFYEFKKLRSNQAFGSLITLLERTGKKSGRNLYLQFIKNMRTGGLITFWEKFPVLARSLAILTQNWIITQQEFLDRFQRDRTLIEDFFRPGKPLGKIADLKLSLSDRHNEGRSVIGVCFESGLHVMYKPRNLGIEVAFNNFFAWLNQQNLSLDLYSPQTLDRGTHGWVAFVDHAPCEDSTEASRYYHRVGMLLCLLYILDATDCHYENIIAHGEYPVFIDNESILQHRVDEYTLGGNQKTAMALAHEKLRRSVLRSGMLPQWSFGKDPKIAYDLSGLGGAGDQLVNLRQVKYTGVNTDGMEMVLGSGFTGHNPNTPSIKGDAILRTEEYSEEIVSGFTELYYLLMVQREVLTGTGGILDAFRAQQVRFIFRSTDVYFRLLKLAHRLDMLEDGADFGIFLERLARVFLFLEEKPAFYAILASERQALSRLDIPYFSADTSSVDLEFNQKQNLSPVRGYFIYPSVEAFYSHLNNYSKEDLRFQAYIIRCSFHSRYADLSQVIRETPCLQIPQERPQPEQVDSSQFAVQAFELAQQIKEHAIWGEDGSVTWVAPHFMSESQRFVLALLDNNFYDGISGIGFFLAALEKVRGQFPEVSACYPSYRDLGRASLVPLMRILETGAENTQGDRECSGIGSGLYSRLYTLSHCGYLLGSEEYLQASGKIMQSLSKKKIERNDTLDIIAGSAGSLLILLAYFKLSRDEKALSLAILCGNHLLEKRTLTSAGKLAWFTLGDVPLTGFSHGCAGIAYALLRLSSATGLETFRTAAEEAIAYEDTLLNEEAGNWADLRKQADGQPFSSDPYHMTAWCHGASGIGLGRLGGLDVLDTPLIRRDIAIAVETTSKRLAEPFYEADHLCCGNMGRIEFLHDAGVYLKNPQTMEFTRQKAMHCARFARANGGYIFTHFFPRGLFCPGFFQGAAGIGYTMLRLAAPGVLPNVLLVE